MGSLRRIWALVIKEARILWQDPKSRFVIIAPPILQLFLFAYAATLEVKNIPMAYVNLDSGKWGGEVVSRFIGSPYFTRVTPLGGVQQIRAQIDSRSAMMALIIPQDFSRKVARGEPAELGLILDGARSNSAQIAASYAQQIASSIVGGVPAVQVRGRFFFNENIIFVWYTLASLLVTIPQITCLLLTGLSVARERELGNFAQILVSPLSPLEILAGKAIPALIVGGCAMGVLMLVARVAFGMPFRGNPAMFAACGAVFLLSISGAGLFISSLCNTQQQAVLGVMMFMVPSVLLSGFASPIANMPRWLQIVTLANPMRHALQISIGETLRGAPASAQLYPLGALVIISAVTLPGGAWLFRRNSS